MKQNLDELFKKISDLWFLTEPAIFSVYCTHKLVSNTNLKVPFRTGKKKIEYSPEILNTLEDTLIEELLKIETIRILLKHPYQRQPLAANPVLLTMASNITINDICRTSDKAKTFLHGIEFNLPENLSFEEYYERLKQYVRPQELSQSQKISQEASLELSESSLGPSCDAKTISECAELSALWQEDEEMTCNINTIIDDIEASSNWGTLPDNLVELIKANRYIEMDYRRMLSYFKTSILSSKRNLTRMKPSRRYGFNTMGSRYALATNILIAVDVSGSVSTDSIINFFSVINRFFKYGIEKIDVIQFDSELKSEIPDSMKKARTNIKITGRGGTSFQPAADFYCMHKEYDGLIYFTDGEAPVPEFKTKRIIDVLWVLCSKKQYDKHKKWISSIKGCRATYIPGPI